MTLTCGYVLAAAVQAVAAVAENSTGIQEAAEGKLELTQLVQ